MNQQRPIHLDLGSIKFPPMAIASILHRVSGLVLFLLFPVMLCFLNQSLMSPTSFEHFRAHLMTSAFHKLVIWIFFSAWIYHLLAGIRHLLMDMGVGETLDAGRRSAFMVIGLAVLGSVVMGAYLWAIM